jgi:hypothetical protein
MIAANVNEDIMAQPKVSRIIAISKYVKQATLATQSATRMIGANKDVTSRVPIMGLDA